ncbi:MAG TPA: hypothetical protein VKY53_01355 [Marinobacter sp.]|nr:hypothetical protein [Marinobacter sp.]
MMMALGFSTVSLAVAAALLVLGYRQLWQGQQSMRALTACRIRAVSAIQQRRLDLMEVRNRARILEDTVSGSASAVEKVHKVIANTTFGLIDIFSSDEEFRLSARKVQQTHHYRSGQVYNALRTTNRAVHILADTLIITKAEKRLVTKSKKVP